VDVGHLYIAFDIATHFLVDTQSFSFFIYSHDPINPVRSMAQQYVDLNGVSNSIFNGLYGAPHILNSAVVVDFPTAFTYGMFLLMNSETQNHAIFEQLQFADDDPKAFATIPSFPTVATLSITPEDVYTENTTVIQSGIMDIYGSFVTAGAPNRYYVTPDPWVDSVIVQDYKTQDCVGQAGLKKAELLMGSFSGIVIDTANFLLKDPRAIHFAVPNPVVTWEQAIDGFTEPGVLLGSGLVEWLKVKQMVRDGPVILYYEDVTPALYYTSPFADMHVLFLQVPSPIISQELFLTLSEIRLAATIKRIGVIWYEFGIGAPFETVSCQALTTLLLRSHFWGYYTSLGAPEASIFTSLDSLPINYDQYIYQLTQRVIEYDVAGGFQFVTHAESRDLDINRFGNGLPVYYLAYQSVPGITRVMTINLETLDPFYSPSAQYNISVCAYPTPVFCNETWGCIELASLSLENMTTIDLDFYEFHYINETFDMYEVTISGGGVPPSTTTPTTTTTTTTTKTTTTTTRTTTTTTAETPVLDVQGDNAEINYFPGGVIKLKQQTQTTIQSFGVPGATGNVSVEVTGDKSVRFTLGNDLKIDIGWVDSEEEKDREFVNPFDESQTVSYPAGSFKFSIVFDAPTSIRLTAWTIKLPVDCPRSEFTDLGWISTLSLYSSSGENELRLIFPNYAEIDGHHTPFHYWKSDLTTDTDDANCTVVIYFRIPKFVSYLYYDPSMSVLSSGSTSGSFGNGGGSETSLLLIIAPAVLVPLAIFIVAIFFIAFLYGYYRERVRRANISNASRKWTQQLDNKSKINQSHPIELTINDTSSDSDSHNSFLDSL